ncbi:MAG TPA: hypothetical protein VFW29_11515, partial [Solirubrobacteraceae bacterium]|nr:hypothetical protein [Solirubrobacteraceae bacterium]
MGAMQSSPRLRRALLRRALPALVLITVAGLAVFALLRLNLHRVGHVLITASPGWIGLALALMALSLVLRSISWQHTLLAALPATH